ncbi:MAG: hypothetical protein HRT69_18165 [Flavobacteriaceae bacterium]|nr:hypothetical protein [Flavobacteriaceae bacterium]
MAKQMGIIKLKGTIGDISFYKTQDGHLARGKGGIEASRIANDPAFQRTRENGSEFGRAGKGGKLLRVALRTLLQKASDNRVTSRLTKDVLAVIKTDATNARGLRTIPDGNLSLLENFEFNKNGKLAGLLYAIYAGTIDRVAGTAVADIPAFIPVNDIVAPSGTTHFKISNGAAEVDFAAETYVFDSETSAVLPWNSSFVTALSLTSNLTANSTLPIFQVIGIEFFQEVNGQMYSLKNGNYNALAIVGIDTP